MKRDQTIMHRIRLLTTITCCILICQPLLRSQDIVRSSGSSQVRVETSMSKEQARDMAEELAIINAIENIYGTYVEQQSDIHVKDGRVNFDIIGNTHVKGEWINTNKLDFKEEVRAEKGDYGTENIVWIICNITGEVRECVSRANLEVLPLNCPIIQCRTEIFFDEEDMFLYFKSPVDGYLSVYLDDGDEAYRLLPYKGMGTLSAVEIDGDKDYIIFSKNNSYDFNEGYPIDALELGTNRSIEYNNLYVVFSESPYVKPILNEIKELDGGYYMPKSLKLYEFKAWLSDCRAAMTDFQSKRIKISIEKR